ncbi:MAG: hypothetical protein M1821_003873 [Bathelium mastoideum]|nr:MAG: hypothetical protein M1821_003873 [Bathelium mastoideum]
MAPSPAAQQQRARIIRDLTQDRVRTRGTNSDAGSNPERDATFTTASSFDPEHEALNSTRQMDNSIQQALPNTRAADFSNPKKYQYLDDGYYLDMAAVGRLFGEPSESSESSVSIEVGRGNRRSSRNTPNKSLPSEDPTENVIFSMGDNSLYEVTATPPGKPRSEAKMKEDGAKNSHRKESAAKRTSIAPDTEERASPAPQNGPSPARSKSNNGRKPSTLAHMHARVTEEYDGSYLSDERPQHTATLTKSTRFGNTRNNAASESAIPTKLQGDNGLSDGVNREQTPKRTQQNGSTNTEVAPGTGTVQSFILPDLPNITELVSGVRADGTPIFSRITKARSRFASASQRTTPRGSQSGYWPIDGVPLPEEEKAIFASLQLLQEKVDELEVEKDQKEQKIGEYENEIIELRTQAQTQREFRRSDSALGTTDDEARGPSSWRIDRAKLESSVKALQTRLDKSEHQKSISDISVKRIVQERDNLVTQVGVAYMNVDELKHENESLKTQNKSLEKENELLIRENDAFRAENQALRDQLAKVMGQREEETQNWTKKEDRLRSKIQRRDDAVKEAREITRELLLARNETQELMNVRGQKKQSLPQNVRRASTRIEKDTQTKISDRIEQELRRTRSDGAAHSLAASPSKQSSSRFQVDQIAFTKSHDGRKTEISDPVTGQRTEAMPDDSTSEAESTTDLNIVKHRSRSRDNTTRNQNQNQNETQNSGKDVTFQSVTEGEDLASLRAVLEEERMALREARAMAAQHQVESEETSHSAVAGDKTDTLGLKRKSSLKDVARAPGANASAHSTNNAITRNTKLGNVQQQEQDETNASRRRRSSSAGLTTKQAKDTTINSATSKTSRRHRSGGIEDFEEMTSAFILPDITLHPKQSTANPATTTERPILTTEAKQVLQSLGSHDAAACTICPQLLSAKAATTAAETATTAALDSFYPVPVSQRQPSTTAADGDVTIRPTQPPHAALRAAIARTEDEVAHAKRALHAAETAYAACDASLGRRKRQALAARVEGWVARVERRSEVVYALYDVLEGLKGQEEGEEGEEETGGLIGADGGVGKGKGLDETLQSIGIDPRAELGEAVKEAVAGVGAAGRDGGEQGKAKKSVGFGMRGGAGGLPAGFYSDEEDEELPWEGIDTDGESLASGRRGSRKISAY